MFFSAKKKSNLLTQAYHFIVLGEGRRVLIGPLNGPESTQKKLYFKINIVSAIQHKQSGENHKFTLFITI